MTTRKNFFLPFLLLCCVWTAVWGQRFQKEYSYPQPIYPYDLLETGDHFVVRMTDGTDPFLDLRLDKSGNQPIFSVFPVPAAFPDDQFVRTSDGRMLVFRNEGEQHASLRFYDGGAGLLWAQNFDFTGSVNAVATTGVLVKAVALPDGLLLLGSLEETYPGDIHSKFILGVKLDFTGQVVWQSKKETAIVPGLSVDKTLVADGKVYFSWVIGIADPAIYYVTCIGLDGVWVDVLEHYPQFNTTNGLAPHPQGGVVAVGNNYSFGPPQEPIGRVMSFDENWQIRWQKAGWPELDYAADVQHGGSYSPALIVAEGSGWVLSGYVYPAFPPPFPFQNQLFLARLDSLGNIAVLETFSTQQAVITTLHTTADGGVVMSYYYVSNNQRRIGIIKTDALLKAYPNRLEGRVFNDQNLNCASDTLEKGFFGWCVEASRGQDTLYAFTNAAGHYELPADTGTYAVKIRPFNPYWEACTNPVQVNFPGENLTDTVDFALQAAVDCPQMEVSVTLPFARRCFNNLLYVHYCNNGTVASPAQIRVVLDPALELVGAEIPVAATSGDTLFFNLPTVEVADCGQFWINAHLVCDLSVLGQTVCADAYIQPDTICLPWPAWSGGQVTVGGYCGGDSVFFWVRNIGTGVTQSLDYVIIEDMVVWRQGSFDPLAPEEADTLGFPAAGATYRLVAEQEPGYPYNGVSPFANGPSAWVEGCNWNGVPPFPGGIVTQFPNDDGNPTSATSCAVVVGSYDPNDKSANPAGVADEHYLLPGTPIEYLIRFQNTGTDTAFRVVIRDALSPMLDPLTLRLLGASHPVDLEIGADATLKFTFDPIGLPDSTTDLAGSQGFVRFSIRPRPTVPIGSVITNTAAIFFDFNPPVYTNTYYHTVDTGFMKKPIDAVFSPGSVVESRLFPNPCRAGDRLQLVDNAGFTKKITLCDVTGRPVGGWTVRGESLTLPGNLAAGLYFLSLTDGRVARLVVLNP